MFSCFPFPNIKLHKYITYIIWYVLLWWSRRDNLLDVFCWRVRRKNIIIASMAVCTFVNGIFITENSFIWTWKCTAESKTRSKKLWFHLFCDMFVRLSTIARMAREFQCLEWLQHTGTFPAVRTISSLSKREMECSICECEGDRAVSMVDLAF